MLSFLPLFHFSRFHYCHADAIIILITPLRLSLSCRHAALLPCRRLSPLYFLFDASSSLLFSPSFRFRWLVSRWCQDISFDCFSPLLLSFTYARWLCFRFSLLRRHFDSIFITLISFLPMICLPCFRCRHADHFTPLFSLPCWYASIFGYCHYYAILFTLRRFLLLLMPFWCCCRYADFRMPFADISLPLSYAIADYFLRW